MAKLSDGDRVKREFWPKLKTSLTRLPFAEDLIAAYYCAFDPKMPLRSRAVLLGALGYFIMPFDVVPDFVLGLGFTDDAAVLIAALTAIRSHMSQAHRDKAKRTLDRLQAETVDATII